MPKKSDRPNHSSTMSDLMPDVSLDEDESESGRVQEEKSSTKEEQSGSTLEEDFEERARGSQPTRTDNSQPDPGLAIYPDQSPDLSEKLGLLVSKEVEELLDEVYLSMRMEHGKKAKKSLIVEAALRYLLNDYQQKGAVDSEISRWLERVAE